MSHCRELALPVSKIAGVVLIAVSIVFWLSNELHSIDVRLDRIERQIRSEWSQYDMEAWAYELSRSNPQLDVPGPSAIKTRYRGGSGE